MSKVEILFIVLWSLIAISFLVVEIFTTNFITIWFTLGALAALISNTFYLQWYYQILVFVLVSFLTLAIFYPLIHKYVFKIKTLKTNCHNVIGKEIIVSEICDNERIQVDAYAYINGVRWSLLKEQNNETLKKDDIVVVQRIKGTRLIVIKIKNDKEK